MKKALCLLMSLLLLLSSLVGCYPVEQTGSVSLENIPAFSDLPYVVLNDNNPNFTEKEITAVAYEAYSDLDYLGRCGPAMACLGRELMPTEDRESISQVKPAGWAQAQYDFVDGKNLYNRCHLIGFQLSGENANPKNLITGTRYLNVEGMLPFENMVADYIKETGNHVMYRITPIYSENCLVARGVEMEALSVEDEGAGICFHIYAYNNQPGVVIDYLTGYSSLDGGYETPVPTTTEGGYILNIKSKKFHRSDCEQGRGIKDENRSEYNGSREELLNDGYTSAGCCKP